MKKSVAAGLMLSWAMGAASAEELFVSIHSAAPMAQGAGLVLAGQALEQKETVRVLPGVTPAKPAEVAAHLLKPGVQTLAF